MSWFSDLLEKNKKWANAFGKPTEAFLKSGNPLKGTSMEKLTGGDLSKFSNRAKNVTLGAGALMTGAYFGLPALAKGAAGKSGASIGQTSGYTSPTAGSSAFKLSNLMPSGSNSPDEEEEILVENGMTYSKKMALDRALREIRNKENKKNIDYFMEDYYGI